MDDKMRELLEDKEFMKAVLTVESPEELAKLFDSKQIGLDGITIEEAFEIVKNADKSEELTEEQLMDANGGIAIGLALSSAALIAFGVTNLSFYVSYGYHSIFKK